MPHFGSIDGGFEDKQGDDQRRRQQDEQSCKAWFTSYASREHPKVYQNYLACGVNLEHVSVADVK